MEDDFPTIHGAAYKELARRFGGVFRSEVTTVNGLGAAAPVLLLNADAERVFVFFGNQGVGTVSVSPRGDILTAGGMPIGVGSDRSFNVNDHAVLPTEEWWALAAIGDSIRVVIVRRVTGIPR